MSCRVRGGFSNPGHLGRFLSKPFMRNTVAPSIRHGGGVPRGCMGLLLCSGGCRSGKSSFARQWIESRASTRVYVATAYAGDEEMAGRIVRHQAERGKGWATLEIAGTNWDEPELWAAEAARQGDAILFDCLTLWTCLCLERGLAENATLALTGRMLEALSARNRPTAVVTNEVGMGLVPDTALGRRFRDVAGLVNQKAAALADTVVFMVSGLPLYIKGPQLSSNSLT